MRPDFHEPTLHPLLQYLMGQQTIRNSFLKTILNANIEDSELLKTSLDPFTAFKEVQQLINHPDTETLMKAIKDIPYQSLRNYSHRPILWEAFDFIRKLDPRCQTLNAAISNITHPKPLDIICKSPHGLIHVEIQIVDKNASRVDALDQVYSLSYGKFRDDFKRKSLDPYYKSSEKIRRIVGISLFVGPPLHPEDIRDLLPWYSVKLFEEEDFKRYFVLCNEDNGLYNRSPDFEFFYFNLEAFMVWFRSKENLESHPKPLCEWLDFFAKAHTKTVADIEAGDYSDPIKQAYALIKDLPPDLEEEYKESLIRREQISHYVQATQELALEAGKKEGKEEAKAEIEKLKTEAEAREAQLRTEAASQLRAEKGAIAQSLLKRGLALDEIAIITGLSLAEIEGLQS
jgi:predicted transposase/invertase (TIGR01784 family)